MIERELDVTTAEGKMKSFTYHLSTKVRIRRRSTSWMLPSIRPALEGHGDGVSRAPAIT